MKSNRFSVFLALFVLFIASGEGFSQMGKVVGLVKGTVTNASGSPAADVSITFFKGSERVNTTKSTPEGKFTQIVQPGTVYRVTFSGDKYYYHEEQLSVPQSGVYQTVPMNVTLRDLLLGQPYPFSNLIFEPKSSDISSNVMADFEAIASAMKHNPHLAISATVHPDETPSGKKAAAQNALAQSRKSAILSFFISKNIPESNVSIDVSLSTGSSGSFQRVVTVDEPVSKSKKKKKSKTPAASSSKNVSVHQDAEVVMQMAS